MAHNYPQPFYGFPFAYPPAPSGEPAAPPNAQPASAPDAFQNIPGLGGSQHPAPFPARKPTQDMARAALTTPATWPPPFPMDHTMWSPQQLLPFLQNGMLPPPPFLPPHAFPPPPLPLLPTPPNANPHSHLPPHPPQAIMPASDRIQEVLDSDREDGEVSEGDVPPQQPPMSAKVKGNGNGIPHREPPRSIPQTQPSSIKALPLAQEDKLQKNRDEVKKFITMLNSNNIGYPALANEGLDQELLQHLYKSLNLPSEPAPIPPIKANGAPQKLPAQTPPSNPVAQIAPANKALPPKPAPTVKTNVAPALSAKSAASPTGPVDRKDYIARLQAAKKAKQAAGAKPSPPQNTPPAHVASPSGAAKIFPAATTPTAKPSVTDEQRARNTELIKQRLEAMRAKQKPSIPVINGTKSSAFLSQQPELACTAAESPTQIAQPSTSTPTTPVNMPSFSSIPGLFMSNHPPSIPQKRPAPIDLETSTPQGSMPHSNQRQVQSPYAYNNTAIEVSDNESNGSAMDIDDDQADSNPLVISQLISQTPRQAPKGTAEASPRPNSTRPASTVGTPGAQTPATNMREKELEDKEKQLAAMRLTLKKKLAEKREKDRAAAAAAAATAASSPPRQDVTMLVSPPHSTSPSEPMAELAHPVRLQSAGDKPNIQNTTEPVRNAKRLRRAEIESRLPSLDAEIATNSSRIAHLVREMEDLKMQNEKIAKDKEELTQELESLGIDTEGMSHEELRAKKEEIQHESPPEPEKTSLEANSVPQSALHRPIATPPVNSQYMVPTSVNVEKSSGLGIWQAPAQAGCGFARLPGLGQVSQIQSNPAAVHNPKPIVHAERKVIAPPTPQKVSRSEQLVVDAVLGGTSTHAAQISGTRLSATPLDDEEDFYSPLVAPVDLDEADGIQPAAQPPSEEGEVEMSESSGGEEEEEYEPDEPMDMTSAPIQDVTSTASNNGLSRAPSQMSTEDEEDYEPPDVDADVPEHIQASQVEGDEDAMDLAASSSEASSDTDSDEETTPEPEMHLAVAGMPPQRDLNAANKLAPGLQVQVVPALFVSEPVASAEDEDEKTTFTPYESPLRFFKSYRYHPSYAQDVAGGFLSLTYSHQIDAEKLLCPNESAGGPCTDVHCLHQHFRDLSITGEKLLVQLGTANPGKTQDEKQKWNDGLRGVLRELRQKNIKDPNGIAVEIAKYRREFLNDDTRVVNL